VTTQLDTEAFRVVVSSVAWCLDERHVNDIAVTRHTVVVTLPIQVRTINVDRKLNGPTMTVEFPCQVMLNHTAPPFREFLLNDLPPPDDRDRVRVVICLKQREALAVLESAIEIDGLDLGVKPIKGTEELNKDAAGGVAVFETAHHQRVAFVLHTRAKSGVGVERAGSACGF
jgi:hypothetical protein